MMPEFYHMAMAIIVVPVFVFIGFDLYEAFKQYRWQQRENEKRDIDDAINAQQSGFPVPSELLYRIESDGR